MSLFGGTESNPPSGETPSDTFSDDTPTGMPSDSDSIADDADAAAVSLDEGDAETGEAVRDPAPAVDPDSGLGDDPVNDIGGIGETRASEPEEG